MQPAPYSRRQKTRRDRKTHPSRAGGRRVYGADEIERLRFIQRLKALGLALSEIKELNAVYAIGGSTRALLERLADLLDRHLMELDDRIDELVKLRGEIMNYRDSVAARIGRRPASARKARALRRA